MLLDEIARKYRSALEAYFRRRLGHGQSETEDLTQEVLIRLAKRGSLDDVHRVEPYLFQTASSVLIDHTRGDGQRRGLQDLYDDDLHAPEDFSPERVLLGKEVISRAFAVIEDLPPRARQAVVLSRFEGMRQAEIATAMGISVSAVEKHLRLGMLRLATIIEDDA